MYAREQAVQQCITPWQVEEGYDLVHQVLQQTLRRYPNPALGSTHDRHGIPSVEKTAGCPGCLAAETTVDGLENVACQAAQSPGDSIPRHTHWRDEASLAPMEPEALLLDLAAGILRVWMLP